MDNATKSAKTQEENNWEVTKVPEAYKAHKNPSFYRRGLRFSDTPSYLWFYQQFLGCSFPEPSAPPWVGSLVIRLPSSHPCFCNEPFTHSPINSAINSLVY